MELNQTQTQPGNRAGSATRDESPPATAVEALQRWNYPRENMWRVFATFSSFIVAGAQDAAVGAIIPYLGKYYGKNYTSTSLVFLVPMVGYIVSSLVNATIHNRLGQRGIAFLGPLAHIITYGVWSLKPPFPVVVATAALSGFGNGSVEAAWNAWTGNMAGANRVQGILQAFYSLGATVSPLVATALVTEAGLEWNAFYYIMTGLACIELVCCLTAFWGATGAKYRMEHPASKGGHNLEALRHRVTWLLTIWIFFYTGTEVSIGGWIVTFMIKVRHGQPYESGIVATGFWGGMAVGRAVLGFVTERFGERLCTSVYLALCVSFQLIFWLVPGFIVSAVAISLLGFFMGPLFPAGIVMSMKLLPRQLHITAIGVACAVGGTGAAGIPFGVGAIAEAKGVEVLQPIILPLLVVLALLWFAFPKIEKPNEEPPDRESASQ